MPSVSRRAFTLAELIAALSLVGFATLGAILLLDGLNDSAGRIVRDGVRSTRDANGERLLARLVLDATGSTDTAQSFRGDENGVAFTTSCDTPGGWSEPCRVRLAIDRRGDSSAVAAELSTGESYSLRAQSGAAQFRYFSSRPARDTTWFRRWASSIVLPAALGIVSGGDTIVYPVSAARD